MKELDLLELAMPGQIPAPLEEYDINHALSFGFPAPETESRLDAYKNIVPSGIDLDVFGIQVHCKYIIEKCALRFSPEKHKSSSEAEYFEDNECASIAQEVYGIGSVPWAAATILGLIQKLESDDWTSRTNREAGCKIALFYSTIWNQILLSKLEMLRTLRALKSRKILASHSTTRATAHGTLALRKKGQDSGSKVADAFKYALDLNTKPFRSLSALAKHLKKNPYRIELGERQIINHLNSAHEAGSINLRDLVQKS